MTTNTIKELRLGLVTEVRGNKVKNIEDFLKTINTSHVTEFDRPYGSDEIDMTQTHRKIKYEGDIYYVFEYGNSIKIFKLLPSVENDDMFYWLDKSCNNVNKLWCSLEYGELTFNIMYYIQEVKCSIIVRYNKVEIGRIIIDDCTINNEVIKEAIDNYRNGLLEEMKISCKKAEPIAARSLVNRKRRKYAEEFAS